MNVSRTFIRWLPQAVFITAVCILIYTVVLQDMRSSADDPQIQLAEDAAAMIAEGQSASSVVAPFGDSLSDGENVDMAASLRPFLIVFNQSGGMLSSAATLDDAVPTPPVGVFEHTENNGQDRFTWQPIPQVRIAAVMVKVPSANPSDAATTTILKESDAANGFVLAGRSLREVEMRENQLLNQVSLAWIILLIVSLGYSIFVSGKNGPAKGGI